MRVANANNLSSLLCGDLIQRVDHELVVELTYVSARPIAQFAFRDDRQATALFWRNLPRVLQNAWNKKLDVHRINPAPGKPP